MLAHEVSFVERLDAVPEDVEVLSVFITERIDDAFLKEHPLIRLIATRSTGCDHIDLDACEQRGVTVANVGNYGENTVAEHTFALILALSRRLRDSGAGRTHGALQPGAPPGIRLAGQDSWRRRSWPRRPPCHSHWNWFRHACDRIRRSARIPSIASCSIFDTFPSRN